MAGSVLGPNLEGPTLSAGAKFEGLIRPIPFSGPARLAPDHRPLPLLLPPLSSPSYLTLPCDHLKTKASCPPRASKSSATPCQRQLQHRMHYRAGRRRAVLLRLRMRLVACRRERIVRAALPSYVHSIRLCTRAVWLDTGKNARSNRACAYLFMIYFVCFSSLLDSTRLDSTCITCSLRTAIAPPGLTATILDQPHDTQFTTSNSPKPNPSYMHLLRTGRRKPHHHRREHNHPRKRGQREPRSHHGSPARSPPRQLQTRL